MQVKVSYDIYHLPALCTIHTTRCGQDCDRGFSRSGRVTTFADVQDFFDHLNEWHSGESCFKHVVKKVEEV